LIRGWPALCCTVCYRSQTVHPDLDRLIRLQALDSRAAEARRLQSSIPETQRALDQKLDGARVAVTAANEQQAANQTSRRALEKDLAAVNTRLTRYKDQLMEVKTNREYHAMQHEIETAQGEVKRVEDQMLELMVAADDLSATLKSAEASLKTAEQDITRERADLDRQLGASDAVLEETLAERRALAAQISPNVLEQYEIVAKGRRGIAVAEARAERCTECHVRLRPMIYSEVRHNKTLVQCDSCQRFLYYVPPPAEGASASA
jgi:predicted  nucleic acid-binding Zn-ribbon protein